MPSRSNSYLKGLTQPKCQFSNVLHQTGLPILTTAPSRCKQDPSQPFFSLVLNWKFYETSFLWLLMLPQPFTGLVQMRPCWPPTPAVPALSQTKVEDSPLSATRSCFVRVSHCGERDFQQDGKAALSLRSLLCQILFTSFPRMAACTVYSQQHPCYHTGASSLGISSPEILCFQEPPKRAGLRLFWNLGLHVAALRKQPGLPSMNQIILCCVHTGWVTLLPISKAQGLGAALHTWVSVVGNQSCSK